MAMVSFLMEQTRICRMSRRIIGISLELRWKPESGSCKHPDSEKYRCTCRFEEHRLPCHVVSCRRYLFEGAQPRSGPAIRKGHFMHTLNFYAIAIHNLHERIMNIPLLALFFSWDASSVRYVPRGPKSRKHEMRFYYVFVPGGEREISVRWVPPGPKPNRRDLMTKNKTQASTL